MPKKRPRKPEPEPPATARVFDFRANEFAFQPNAEFIGQLPQSAMSASKNYGGQLAL